MKPVLPVKAPLVALARVLDHSAGLAPAGVLCQLVKQRLDALPLPGAGATLARWQALAAVGACDLSLAKLYEGHTDALAILQELGVEPQEVAPAPEGVPVTWGVWAAEAPGARVQMQGVGHGVVRLSGTKAWCSGAHDLSHALLTAWRPECEQPQLVAVALRQPGVSISQAPWQAVGMAASASADVTFNAVPAVLIGAPGDYLARPGFWHGGAGVAACWHGAAAQLGQALWHAARTGAERPDAAFRWAAVGKVDVALSSAAAVLRETAAWIDVYPGAEARRPVLRARQCVEGAARKVLEEVMRSLGAGPLCRDAGFARRAADLPVFIRQSHAERDDAALGQGVCAEQERPWLL